MVQMAACFFLLSPCCLQMTRLLLKPHIHDWDPWLAGRWRGLGSVRTNCTALYDIALNTYHMHDRLLTLLGSP